MDLVSTTIHDTRNIMSIEKNYIKKRRVSALVVVGLAICTISVAIALREVFLYSLYGDLQYWAEKIERNEPVELRTLQKLDKIAADLLVSGECQSQFIKAVVSLRLIAVDNVNQDREYEKWSSAVIDADAAVDFAALCLPTDGNLWLRMAMIKSSVAEQPDDVAKYLRRSQLYAPSEYNVVRGRFLLYNKLAPSSLELVKNILRYDTNILCSIPDIRLRLSFGHFNSDINKFIKELNPKCDITRQ